MLNVDGRGYRVTLPTSAMAVTTARTLIYVTAPSNGAVLISRGQATQANLTGTDQLYAALQRITTLGTPTATSITPKPIGKHGAALFTAKGNVTASEPTYTADDDDGLEGYHIRSGWYYKPDHGLIVEAGASAGLRLLSAPPSSMNVLTWLTVWELF